MEWLDGEVPVSQLQRPARVHQVALWASVVQVGQV